MIFPGAVVHEPLRDTLCDLRWEGAAGGRLGFLAVVVDRNIADGVGDVRKPGRFGLLRCRVGVEVVVADRGIAPLPAFAAAGSRGRWSARDRREVLLDRLELRRIVAAQVSARDAAVPG